MYKNLRIGFKAITFGSYGSFGTSTHLSINKATADAQQSVFNPWVRPGPRQHAYLLFGFSLARANARMLLNADSKRRSARNSVRALNRSEYEFQYEFEYSCSTGR